MLFTNSQSVSSVTVTVYVSAQRLVIVCLSVPVSPLLHIYVVSPVAPIIFETDACPVH